MGRTRKQRGGSKKQRGGVFNFLNKQAALIKKAAEEAAEKARKNAKK